MKNIIGIIIGCMIVIISLGALVYFNPGLAENDCPIPTQEVTPIDKVVPNQQKQLYQPLKLFQLRNVLQHQKIH